MLVIHVDTRSGWRTGWGEDSSLAHDWRYHVARALITSQGEDVYAGLAAGFAFWASHAPPQGGWAKRLAVLCDPYVRRLPAHRVTFYSGLSRDSDIPAMPFMRAEDVGGEPEARQLFRDLTRPHSLWDDSRYGVLVERTACGVLSTPPQPPSPSRSVGPVLLSPANGAELPQRGRRDSSTGGAICLDVTPLWVFSWSPDGTYSRFRLVVQHRASQFPAIDAIVGGTSFSHARCGYVADHNRLDWEWFVRGVGADGSLGPPSEIRTFTVAPLS